MDQGLGTASPNAWKPLLPRAGSYHNPVDEPPVADPHVRWCGRRLEIPRLARYPANLSGASGLTIEQSIPHPARTITPNHKGAQLLTPASILTFYQRNNHPMGTATNFTASRIL